MPINCGGYGDVIEVVHQDPGANRLEGDNRRTEFSPPVSRLVVQDSYPLDPGAVTTRLNGLLHGRLGCLQQLIEI